ncbi:MAG: beta-lactamase family protein [bacterium]|nr:beta-lactamase family protein [bacterium]
MKIKKRFFIPIVIVVLLAAILLFGNNVISQAATNLFRETPGLSLIEGPDPLNNEQKLQLIEKSEKKLDSWLKTRLNRGVVPAAVAGVVENNRLILHSGAYANLDTKFGIASLTKTFTAILTLQLAENGYLSLDDPVKLHLPNVVIERKELNSAPVTVRHLLLHTSGMPTFGRGAYQSVEINGKQRGLPQQVNPTGYCYAYSNPGYVLLKHVIEAASGKSYEQNLQERIFIPLNMTTSTGKDSNGTGGIVTNLRDLAKYTSMLIQKGKYGSKRILSPASFNIMLAKPGNLPPSQVDYHYSLSWEVITVNNQVDSYYKAGRWYGEASVVQVFPKKKMALIFLCNPPQHLIRPFMSWRQGLTAQLQKILRNVTGDQTLCTSWPRLSTQELKQYQGIYTSPGSGHSIKISFNNGKLFSNRRGGPQRLREFTSNRFLMGKGNLLHSFVWKNNEIIGLSLTSGYFKKN